MSFYGINFVQYVCVQEKISLIKRIYFEAKKRKMKRLAVTWNQTQNT